MGSGRAGPTSPDLFSTASPREPSSLDPKRSSASKVNAVAKTLRHVLPSDLPSAIKYLDDQELDQLLAAVIAERLQRGKTSTLPEKPASRRPIEATAVSLTPGKLNAVRAAFKAGVTPSRIAKEFGISQPDVRKVIASERKKR
jgi:predicted DNA-binding protein (UPF0251 family)